MLLKKNSCNVYDSKENKIHTWKILEDKKINTIKIRTNKNKVYVSVNDNFNNWVKIF